MLNAKKENDIVLANSFLKQIYPKIKELLVAGKAIFKFEHTAKLKLDPAEFFYESLDIIRKFA